MAPLTSPPALNEGHETLRHRHFLRLAPPSRSPRRSRRSQGCVTGSVVLAAFIMQQLSCAGIETEMVTGASRRREGDVGAVRCSVMSCSIARCALLLCRKRREECYTGVR
uniref:Uncharacterized protein n=1 Tax=Physcomitrium patens TaxID=3218 RepID=A0A2K1IFK3_PHYPA|nr:hypothetical protein PHYPA_028648 [Physcomitrium patens]